MKKVVALIFTVGFLSFPLVTLAGPAWGVTADSSGNIGLGFGSSASSIAATNGGYGGYFGGGGWSLSNQYGLPQGSILGIASNLLFWLLALFAILGVIGFVLSGIFYLLAGANEDLAKKGKSGMTASIIGLVVGLSGFVIMQAVASLLGGVSKTF